MNKKQMKNLTRIIIAAVLMVGLHFVPATGWLRFCLYMVPYLVVGYDILIKAWKGIKNLQPMDECLLMTIATLGAIAIALMDTGDYVEAVAVMLFYQVGEWFQSYAIDRSRKNIGELMDIRPDYANVLDDEGKLVHVDPDEVSIGTTIICQPGERIPIDGVIRKGESSLDTVALTGESVPRNARVGDEVLSGTINLSGVLEIETTKEFDESTASKILDLVENASSRKAKSEDFISKFARVYTPVVVICALVLALIPPVVLMVLGREAMWLTWLYRALIFLVISCPCALVISIPLSFFGGIGGASRAGILIKGANYLEALSKTKYLVCDKTGTLTEGVFKVVGIHLKDALIGEDKLLELAAHSECASSHPISKSLQEAYAERSGSAVDRSRVTDITEDRGRGVKALVDGIPVATGNDMLLEQLGLDVMQAEEVGTILHVAVNNEYAGYIVIADVIKETSKAALDDLRKLDVSRIVMLTGDGKSAAEHVAESLGINEVHSKLLPEDKVRIVSEIISGKKENETLAFVGDGLNDAPVLVVADVGIAMGAIGSDAAIEAADVVLMDDDPKKIGKAIGISRKCLRIVKENIWFAISVKVACLILGALGLATMWLAIFADVGVMVLAVLNALRCLKVSEVG